MTTINRSESIESLSLPTSQTSNDYDIIDQSNDNINKDGQKHSCQMLENNFISKISEVLDLDDTAESKMIVKQLMVKGQQALSEYENDIARNIFQKQINTDHSELLDLLKNYVEQQWQSISEEWFQLFLAKQKTISTDLYNQILTRTAQWGSKFTKDNVLLSLVIQFLFELNDETMQNDELFNKIWHTLITQGRQGIKQYSDYIAPTILTEQLENDQSPLYLALRDYYREPLNDLLKQQDVNINKPDITKTALNCIANRGWWNGLHDKEVQDLLAPKKFRILVDQLNLYLIRNKLSSVSSENSNSNSMSATSESSMNMNSSLLQLSSTTDSRTLTTNMEPLVPKTIAIQDDIPQQKQQQQINENKIISICINEYEKLQLSDLVEAGELMYINQKFDQVLDKIIEDFQSQQHFSKFIHDCLTPIMYLLKRHQSLDDFIESLFFKYSQVESSLITPKLSLRMIVHILLLNSDLSLSRMIMSLLSKRNPIPFLEPSIMNESSQSYQFIPDIFHVWDYTIPTILSFGIGKCFGKSILLNTLFMSTFEQSTQSIYFQNTIDIDFGYSFLPRRSTNIADAHGLMTKELLVKIYELFDGFIIHIDYTYLSANLETVLDMLSVLKTDYQRLIVRDVPESLRDQCSALLSSRFSSNPSIQTFILPNIADQTNKQNKHCILTLQNKIFEKIPTKCLREQNYMKNELKQLMNIEYKHNMDDMYRVVMPLKQRLIQAVDDNCNAIKYFPEYSKFVELCELQLKLARFNFYGNENDTIVSDTRRKIFELESNTETVNHSIIFNLFLNMLQAPNMLMCLELLTAELKQERARLISAGEMANQLSIQKSLSLEVLWRNAIVCSQHQPSNIKEILYQKYYEFISAGFPFEIVDGDNFYFQDQFLLQTLKPFHDKKTLVISVIGQQNSGKSTLLNYMFGTLFDVRDGRCTRGIYGSFVKSNLPDFDYIMLIDTEGLLGMEREDPEYDRRIVLFCLAVSHIVIVNMIGEFNTSLQAMLTLCTDSLEKMGVTRIPQPVVHFILNQRADLNIENSKAAIDRIISDLKKFGLGQSIDIRKETFHTLPSAFKKEGHTLASNTKLPNTIKTEPDFIECVQLLCGEIIHSAGPCSDRSFEFSDPLQWLILSKTIFDTLQKFSDLTYYRDINERRLDNEIREHIRNDLTKIFTSDYRDQLIIESSHQNENAICELFLTKQNKIQENTDQNVENLFKLLKAPDAIRIRSRQFLRTQIIEMFNALRTTTIAVNEREKVKLLVRNGEGDLKKLINDTIDRGVQMSSDAASQEFNKMFDNSIKYIESKFVPEKRLNQAFKHIYTNYNIYEKECLPNYQDIFSHFSMLMNSNEKQTSVSDLKDKLIFTFTALAYKNSLVTAHYYNPETTNLYSIEIIEKLVYLNKELLQQEFIEYFNQHSPQVQQPGSQNRRDCDRNQNKSGIRKFFSIVTSPFRDNNDNKQKQQPQQTIISNDEFQIHIRQCIQRQKPKVLTPPHIDDENMFLRISKIIQEILQQIMTAMKGVEENEVRQIRTELIQKIVGLVNSLITNIDNELIPFCLTLSLPVKSIFHTYTVIILTKYYYDEQMNHFKQTLSEMEKNKNDLKEYFINMVAPNASVETNYAIDLGKQLKAQVIENLRSDGQHIIDSELRQYDEINREWIQDRCDGQLITNKDMRWHLDYIENPTKIIEQFFINIWGNIEHVINQKLIDQKTYYKNILVEFFNCLRGVLDAVRNLGPATKFVDEIFQPEESNSLDAHKNLINKKRCMTILLHKYFSGERIRSSYLIKTKTYILKTDALDAFKLLSKQREPSNDLIATMKEMSSVFDNISIGNLVLFLQSLLNEEKQIMDEFNQIKSDFNTIDTQDTYARLWDKVRGCLDLCPCCKRPCDFDHTQIKSRPGSQYNEHRCTSGHALRAMNGYKFEVTDEASLLMCEQITDDQIIVVDSKRYKWSEFKSHHSNWNFESALGDNELNKLHGKFLTVWGKVGRELCKKHNMKYVTYNTTPGIIHESFHYILLLDGSSSMRGQRWEDLLKAVQEFLTRRRELNTQDHVTIIVFSRAAKIKYFDYEIDKVDLTTIESSGGRTNFGAAFKCVNDCIDRPKKDTSSNTNNHYAIIFMSDGEAPYPEQELNQLLHAHDSVIKRFWTVSLGDPNSVAAQILEKINEKMNGSFYDIEASNDLINAYAEIASSSTSNNGSI